MDGTDSNQSFASSVLLPENNESDMIQQESENIASSDGVCNNRNSIYAKNLVSITYYPSLRRSARISRPPDRFTRNLGTPCLLSCTMDTISIAEALIRTDSIQWKEAMQHELNMIRILNT